MRIALVAIVAALVATFLGSAKMLGDEPPAANVTATFVLPDTPLDAFQNALLPSTISNDRQLFLGGIGSDLWHDPKSPSDEFWMITDRGPNGKFKRNGEKRRTFPVPEFNPAIVHVKAESGALRILDAIELTGNSGKSVTGLPNSVEHDEIPYDFSAEHVLATNPNGLDPEGLVRTSDGQFWVAEEYGPSLLKVDKSGRILKRYAPEGLPMEATDYPLAKVLPAVYQRRQVNRGFEGLSISADEKTLYLLLQSPLSNPDVETGHRSRNVRLLAFDVATEKPIHEYVYRCEKGKAYEADLDQNEVKLSALAIISQTRFLVVERTDEAARIYAVDLAAATDILSTRWHAAAPDSLEALKKPQDEGLFVLPKALILDLARLQGIPHKVEGLAVLDAHTIAIANDNDFDVGTFDDEGHNHGAGVKTQLLVIHLEKPLF